MYTALVGLSNEHIVAARDCFDKEWEYRCPECGNRLILKRGAIKTPHFAHKENILDCEFGKYESESHLRLKDWLYQKFSNNDDEVHAEYKIDDKDTPFHYIFADIYVVPKGTDMPIAFEILTKGVTVNDILERIEFYRRNNIAVLFLQDESFYRKIMGHDEFKVSEPIKYLYKYFYNILYVFDGEDILACKIKNAEHTSKGGYDSYGDYHEPRTYICKTIYNLTSYRSVDLLKQFSRNRKDEYGWLPPGYIYRLKYDIAKLL